MSLISFIFINPPEDIKEEGEKEYVDRLIEHEL